MNFFHFQYIQFFFLFLISWILSRSKHSSIQFIDSQDSDFHLLQSHIQYSEIRSLLDSDIQQMFHNPEISNVYLKKTNPLHKEHEYMYLFYTPYLNVYFSKRKQENENEKSIDRIYFEGLHKITDLHKISFSKFFQQGYLSIDPTSIHEKGILLKMTSKHFYKVFEGNLMNAFFYVKKKEYKKKDDQYHLCMEGYSLGGIYSQYFIYELAKMKKMKNYHIQYYNVESWFSGNEEKYQELKRMVDYKNIKNQKSFMYIYNRLFQQFHEVDRTIGDTKMDMKHYLKYPFPFGIIKYFIQHHMLHDFFTMEEK